MSESKYIRDEQTNCLILRHPSEISQFKTRRNTLWELDSLKGDINTLKSEISALRAALETLQASK